VPDSEVATINVSNTLIDLSDPLIMGVINLTPDSFFDGGRYSLIDNAIEQARKLLVEGADMLDVGAYSSRPGASYVTEQEEIDRLIPFVERCKWEFPDAIISIDTFRSEVAKAAISNGAHLINDISGGSLDDAMFEMIGRLQVPYILMHMRGTPETMQSLTNYEDLMSEICIYFAEKIGLLRSYGVKDIILDPGPGFAKNLDQNFELINRFSEFKIFGLPLLGAISRKSMIYKSLGVSAQDALNGTTALNTVLLLKGANILRVHDVKEAKEVVLLIKKLK